jgi:TfoX/Sxy family transcriptional regulator of competence genes
MPSFDKSPPALVERFRALAALVPEATQRPMFGYPSLVVGGNMFISLFGDSLILRLGDADRAALLAVKGATTFEPMPGRPMREYVVAPPTMVAGDAIEPWVARSYAHAKALPAKAAKPAKPRKKT